MGRAYMHGWVSLPLGGEVFLEHGVPTRAWVSGDAAAHTANAVEGIRAVTGLNVTLEEWEPGEEPGQSEAWVHVSPREVGKVLQLLAYTSGEAFYDRYHKRIDAEATDYDEEAYAHDFDAALHFCGLHWGDVDKEVLHEAYVTALHAAVEEMASHSK